MSGVRYTNIELQQKLDDLYGTGTYTLNWSVRDGKSIVVVKNGIQYKTPVRNILLGKEPTIRSVVNIEEYYKEKFNELSLEFKDFIYSNVKEKVTFICDKHGEYDRSIWDVLNKSHKCPRCVIIDNTEIFNKTAGWSFSIWKKSGESSINFDSFKLYVLKIWNDEESFYKIGKTFTSIGVRFNDGNSTALPYNYKVVDIIEGSALYISNLETELHRYHNEYKYEPSIQFKGWTECYSIIEDKKIKANKAKTTSSK